MILELKIKVFVFNNIYMNLLIHTDSKTEQMKNKALNILGNF